MPCGVYLIECIPTGKKYIGSSLDIHTRWKAHFQALRSARHYNPHLQRAFKVYGEPAFRCHILAEVAADVLKQRETNAIAEHNTTHPAVGYNLSKDASRPRLGIKWTDEQRLRMSIARKGRIPTEEARRNAAMALRGHKVSEDTREKIGAAHRGKAISEAHRKALSVAHTGRKRPPRSLEWSAKLSAALMGRKLSEEHRAKCARGRKAVSPQQLAAAGR